MLEHLEIKNYALIENISVDFSDGFNVITGETGAGKSIILGALGLLMGEKADSDCIRNGCDEMVVNAVISVPAEHEINSWLKENDIEVEDGRIIVKRIVRSNGKSIIKIQDTLVSRSNLSFLADSLIDMHGQSEHQSLLIPEKQRKIVDSYAGNLSCLHDTEESYQRIRALEEKKREIEKQIEESSRMSDYLTMACSEIESVNPIIGEDEQLKEKISVIGQSEAIFENLNLCSESLSEVKTKLYNAFDFCKKASKSDAVLNDLTSRLESQCIENEDILRTIREYISQVDFSEDALNAMQERLAQIQKLKRKYGPELNDVFSFKEDAKEKLDIAENSVLHLDKCDKELKEALSAYNQNALKLSENRKKAAKDLEGKIEETLRGLGMPSAVFRINVVCDDNLVSAHGYDVIKFEICANPGETIREIREIASGGELSRVMLALKTVLAKSDDIQTQVFDEVDAGIGGAVASNLASCISNLSASRQVIAITHLASVASRADTQFAVSKTVENGRTFTHLKISEGEDRVREIARMLSGDNTEVSLEHARQLLTSSH